MNRWALFLLWLLKVTTDCSIHGIEEETKETVDDDDCDEMLTVDWLEYCYAISDDGPKGDGVAERHQA